MWTASVVPMVNLTALIPLGAGIQLGLRLLGFMERSFHGNNQFVLDRIANPQIRRDQFEALLILKFVD